MRDATRRRSEKKIICEHKWKSLDFSATQILREIYFGVAKSAKTAILAFLEARNVE